MVDRAEGNGSAEMAQPSSTYEAVYDAAADRRVRRKLDINMLPLFFVLCK